MAVVNGVMVALPPPEGYEVDFDNPQRQSVTATYVVSAVGMTLSLMFLGQRLYVKTYIRNSLGIDDALLVISWAAAVVMQALIIRSFANVIIGVHGWEIPLTKFQEFSFYGNWLNSVIYAIPTCLSKVVILLFFRDLNNPQAWWLWSIYSVMFVVAGGGIGIFFSSIFACDPISKSWAIDPTAPGTCINRPAMYQATAALGVATDVLILAIPVPMVLGLHMSMSKKVGLLLMFAIGSATVVTSMVRLWLLISSLDEIDLTWGGGPISLWICIEANLLIMCASLSTLRHFVKTIAPRIISSSDPQSKQTSHGVSTNNELRTFGASSYRSRSQYNRFDDMTGLETVVEGHGDHGKGGSPEARSLQDERSDKAIFPVATVIDAEPPAVASRKDA